MSLSVTVLLPNWDQLMKFTSMLPLFCLFVLILLSFSLTNLKFTKRSITWGSWISQNLKHTVEIWFDATYTVYVAAFMLMFTWQELVGLVNSVCCLSEVKGGSIMMLLQRHKTSQGGGWGGCSRVNKACDFDTEDCCLFPYPQSMLVSSNDLNLNQWVIFLTWP